jgi:hypothetical protein
MNQDNINNGSLSVPPPVPLLQPNLVWYITILAWVSLFIMAIFFLAIYTSTAGKHVATDSPSEDKITVLQQAFQTSLGPRWPYVLLAITILLGFCLYFLYLASSNESVVINLDDTSAHRLNIILIIIAILFGIAMVLLSVKQYLNYRRAADTGNIPNYIPNITQEKTALQILAIVGLSLFILIGGGMAIWFIFGKR